jgi:hypothetical protein
MNARVNISTETAAPVFPSVYAMHLNAPNGAGDYQHGDLIVCNTAEEPTAGDLVCVHTRKSGAVFVVLTMSLPPGDWNRMPFTEAAESTSHGACIGKILGTDRGFAFALQDAWAVHKCNGAQSYG